MAKLTPNTNTSKLTAVGFESYAEYLQDTHPNLAQVLGDQKKLDELERILRAHTTLKMIDQLERTLAAKIPPCDALDALNSLDLPTRYEMAARESLQRNPVGTVEWVLTAFPDARDHFSRLMLDASEAEQTLRDLTVHYNYTGLDAEEIPNLLGFINDFCNVLRRLAAIQEKRGQEMAKVERVIKTRQLEPQQSPHRA